MSNKAMHFASPYLANVARTHRGTVLQHVPLQSSSRGRIFLMQRTQQMSLAVQESKATSV